MWLIGLSIIFVVVIIVFAIVASARHKALPGFESAFGTDPLLYPLIFILIGIVWVVGTYMYFSDLISQGVLSAIDISFIIFSALSAISVTFFAVEMYQDSRRKAPFALSIVPTLFMCFWLILLYRQNASNPVLLSYIYQCIAIVATALSFYFTSGFLYGKPAPGKAIVTYYCAIFFCAVALADGHHISTTLIYLSLIAINLVYSSMLLRNLQKRQSFN